MKAPQPGFDLALTTEFVVGKVGLLIGAPVCEVEAIEIPPALLPWEYKPGVQLPTGVGSATRQLGGVVSEIRPNLTHRSDDDNKRRQVGVYALVDWCFGDDFQWLLQVDAQWSITSHDHGWYLPPGGPNWSETELRANVHVPKVLPDDPSGLDPNEIINVAQLLRAVQPSSIQAILNQVPQAWTVTDAALECLGWFLYTRASEVADRLEAL